MPDMETTIRRNMVKAMVMRQITCRFTGRVLDMDTCAVLIDADADPTDVAHESVMTMLTDADHAQIAAQGCKMVVAPYR